MKFGVSQKFKFGSEVGSYSIVTEREHYDSQITATDFETNLLIDYFGRENIWIGNVTSNKAAAQQKFKKYPSGETIYLNLVFPKPEKKELRLYLSAKAGFKPKANEVWFIYTKETEIWIGSMSEAQWRSENSLLLFDEDEQKYQDSIEELDDIKRTTLKERDVFSRDRKLALKRLEQESFKCEFDPTHKLFISKHTHRPYLEAHHLLPMALQNVYQKNLDVLDNIFCLCPNCHRAIHHSERTYAIEIIDTLIDKRPTVLKILKIESTDVHRYYSLEDIAAN
jgi:5-methylcytosine-specific restriction enzyme A